MLAFCVVLSLSAVRLRRILIGAPALLLYPFLLGPQSSPITCLSSPASTTLEALITCFDAYSVPHGYYDQMKYDVAQPNKRERAAWNQVISSLLTVDNNCTSLTLPSALTKIYAVSVFTERNASSYCVLSERNGGSWGYTRGWGLMVVPASRAAVSRNVHFSAPHPGYDLGTPQQAAVLFKSTGAKSLLVPGRVRTAFLDWTNCVVSNAASTVYYKTDTAHDNNEPFFDASKAIRTWQNANGGCPASSCAYIQMHGKGSTTCPSDNIFLSSGLGNNTNSKSWYTNPTDRPIKRLKSQLDITFPTWTTSLPPENPCILTATKNIFGRLLNGIEESRVCTNGSNKKLATGEFLHIEQDSMAREGSAYMGWTKALKNVFETTCMAGMAMDPLTKLCA